MQIVVIVSTWNANKVVGHPPNFASKFISCVAILFHTYAVVKLVVFSCPTLGKCDPSPFHRYLVHVKFSPSWSPLLYVALTCLAAFSTSVNEMLGTSHQQKLCPYLSLSTAYSLTLHKE